MQRESHMKFSVNQQKRPITRMPALYISIQDEFLVLFFQILKGTKPHCLKKKRHFEEAG